MSKLFRYFLALTYRRAKPSEVPYSLPLLSAMIAINIVVEVSTFITGWPLPITTIVSMNIGSYVLILLMFYGLLAFKSLQERWVQMSTAWLGVNAVLSSAILVIAIISLFVDVSQVNAVTASLSFVELMLRFWLILVTAYILQFGLNVSKLLGVALTIVIFFTSIMAELRIAYRLSPDEMADIEAKVTQALQTAQSKSINHTEYGQTL